MPSPRIILKLATSLDGRIATASGESQWITGEAARAEAHKLRASVDAVMIGAGTARADNPSLLARTSPPPAKQPARLVITTRFDIPFEGRLFEALDQSPLYVFGAERLSPARQAILEGAGARVEAIERAVEGLDMNALIARLSVLEMRSILVEGGGQLAAAIMAAGLIDRIEWFRAPLTLGQEGKPAIGPLALGKLADAPRWARVAVREAGPDLWETYERAR